MICQRSKVKGQRTEVKGLRSKVKSYTLSRPQEICEIREICGCCNLFATYDLDRAESRREKVRSSISVLGISPD